MVGEAQKRHWRSVAVEFVLEAEICHGTESLLRVAARVRVQQPLQICLGCRSISKKCDKQLTHIVRVMRSWYYFLVQVEIFFESVLIISVSLFYSVHLRKVYGRLIQYGMMYNPSCCLY